jgi:ATP-binding cassette subfamily C protein
MIQTKRMQAQHDTHEDDGTRQQDAATAAPTSERGQIVVHLFEHLHRLIGLMRWRAGAALLLLFGTGLLEGAGLLLLIPLLGAVGLDIQQGSVGRLGAFVAAGFASLGLTPTLPLVLTVFLLVNVLLSTLRRAHSILSTSLEQDVVRQTTRRLYAAFVRMDWLTFSRFRSSDLTVALTSESERVGLAASQLLSIAATGVVAAVYIGLAWRLSPEMTAAVFGSATVLVVLLRRRTEKAAKLGAAYSDAVHDFQAAVTDDLGGMKTIRSFVAEGRSLSRFSGLADRLSAARVASTRNYSNATFRLEIGSVVMLSALVLVAVDVLRFDATALLLLLFLFARIVPRLASLQHNVQFYAGLLPSVHRLAKLEAQCLAAAVPEPDPAPALRLRHGIRLESVSFRYGQDGPAVLSNLDLRIDAGSTVAIVGSSGAGKTTIADVMMGLLTPQSGRVLVDDVPLTPRSVGRWRRTTAYVSQEIFLFHDTVRANLRWAVPDATDDDIATALTVAAADFVFDLPSGLDTIVGDRGLRLSGGERQRIALARALLQHPSLLILDEATSALDAENESRILEAIHRLRGSLTIVIITHRLSAIVGADLIHVLDGGRVDESGAWSELIASPEGRFRELCRVQGVPLVPPPSFSTWRSA